MVQLSACPYAQAHVHVSDTDMQDLCLPPGALQNLLMLVMIVMPVSFCFQDLQLYTADSNKGCR